jgi:hypothetical protein
MLRWFAIVLLTLTACFQAFGSISFAWVCEGRVCSTDPFHCCCNAVDERLRDFRCSGGHFSSNTLSGPDCKCKCHRTVTCHPTTPDQSLTKFSAPIATTGVLVQAPSLEIESHFTGRIVEAPLLSRPPPGAWQDIELEQTLLRGPPL